MPGYGQASSSGGARGEGGSGGAFAGQSWHPDMQGYADGAYDGMSSPPSQYDPPKTFMGSFLGNLVGGLTRLSPFGSGVNQLSSWTNGGLTPGQIAQRDYDGYAGMNPAERGAWQDRREAGYADHGSYPRGPERGEYSPGPIPGGFAPPPVDDDGGGGGSNLDPGSSDVPFSPTVWRRTRLPNPEDYATYGQGPAHSFFNYET